MNALAQLAALPYQPGPVLTLSRLLMALVLVILGLWLVLRYLRFQSERISAAWQELAAELDFSYKPARGPVFRRKSEEIEGVVDGITVRLTRYGLSPGLDTAIYTRWSAELDSRPDFVLYVHRRIALSHVASLLGYDDLDLGDPEFDRRFSTKSDEPARARQALTAGVRDAIAKLRAACILVNETGVNVVWSGQIVDPGELKSGLEALRALVRALPAPPAKPRASDTHPTGGSTGGAETPKPDAASPETPSKPEPPPASGDPASSP